MQMQSQNRTKIVSFSLYTCAIIILIGLSGAGTLFAKTKNNTKPVNIYVSTSTIAISTTTASTTRPIPVSLQAHIAEYQNLAANPPQGLDATDTAIFVAELVQAVSDSRATTSIKFNPKEELNFMEGHMYDPSLFSNSFGIATATPTSSLTSTPTPNSTSTSAISVSTTSKSNVSFKKSSKLLKAISISTSTKSLTKVDSGFGIDSGLLDFKIRLLSQAFPELLTYIDTNHVSTSSKTNSLVTSSISTIPIHGIPPSIKDFIATSTSIFSSALIHQIITASSTQELIQIQYSISSGLKDNRVFVLTELNSSKGRATSLTNNSTHTKHVVVRRAPSWLTARTSVIVATTTSNIPTSTISTISTIASTTDSGNINATTTEIASSTETSIEMSTEVSTEAASSTDISTDTEPVASTTSQ